MNPDSLLGNSSKVCSINEVLVLQCIRPFGFDVNQLNLDNNPLPTKVFPTLGVTFLKKFPSRIKMMMIMMIMMMMMMSCFVLWLTNERL